MKVSKLKDKARAHEQKENWQAAIQAYQTVLESDQIDDSEAELPLFNRVGDLYLRVGDPDRAVEYYQQAADRYAEIGLYNNAIALCNKALRYLPNHAILFRKLGQFSAAQGFLTDARRYFLDYAEREVRAGNLAEGFAALEEFADLSDDPEIRELLADQLQGAGHENDAVAQLKKAYLQYLEQDDADGAAQIEAKIRELDPDAEMPERGAEPLEAEPAAGPTAELAGEPESLAFESTAGAAGLAEETAEIDAPTTGDGIEAIEGVESTPEMELDEEEAGPVQGLEVGFGETAVEEEPEAVETEGLTGLETFETEVPAGPEEAAGAEGVASDEDVAEPALEVAGDAEGAPLEADAHETEVAEDVEEEVEPLPTLDVGEELPGGAEPVADEAGPLEGEAAEEEEAEPLPLLDDDEVEPGAEAAEPLEEEPVRAEADGPLEAVPEAEAAPEEAEAATVPDDDEMAAFDLDEIDLGLGGDLADAAEAQAARAAVEVPEDLDVDAILGRAKELVSRGIHDAALREMGILSAADVSEDVYREALEVVNEMIRREPDDVGPYQRRVEYASRIGDEAMLADSYRALAECLTRAGAETKAAAVYQRVLDLEPGDEAARAAVGAVEAEAGAESDDYVDLEAILREAPPEEGGRVAEAAGAVNQDFSELFSQFKARVTEDVTAEESGSHYDLGLAFKEMGLIDEAIAEFQRALQGGEERLKIYEELGQCFVMMEQYNVAIKILSRALELEAPEPSDLLGVYYHLGLCHEELGRRAEAKAAYDEILSLDPSFRDVPERAARL